MTRDWARGHRLAVFGVGKASIHRLIKEDDISIRVPAVFIERDVLSVVRDRARSKFKEKPSRRAAAWAAIEPQNEWGGLWSAPRFEEPVNINSMLDHTSAVRYGQQTRKIDAYH